jgi:hypothetical protein
MALTASWTVITAFMTFLMPPVISLSNEIAVAYWTVIGGVDEDSDVGCSVVLV